MKQKLPLGMLLIMLATGTQVSAQNPGGIIPAAWYRADAAGALFSDAGTTPAATNSTVQQWNGLGGLFPLLQATAASRPVYSNTTTLANFNPTLTFDGTNDWMQFTAGTGINVIDRANGTIYAAGFMNTLKYNGFMGFHASMDYPGLHVYSGNYNLLFFTGGPGYQGQSAAPFTAQSFFTAGTAWQNGAGGTPAYTAATVSLNGVHSEYTGNQMYNVDLTTAARDLRIGADNNYGSFSGQLNEILVFEDRLTPSQMGQVETYLAVKYGTSYANGTKDYKNSTGATVWTAAANAGNKNNIAGIARDDNGALLQKQSWSTNAGQQVLIGVGGLVNTNAANSGTLANNQYLIWGDNGLSKTPSVAVAGMTGLSHRFASIWKVQNTGVGAVRVAWPKNLSNLSLIQSSDSIFAVGDVVTTMTGEVTINSVVYNYADVTLTDGQYFTFAAKLAGPGGVTTGILMWHKADDGTVAAGQKNIWKDVSGNGRDVTQNNNAAYQPTLVTAAKYTADNKDYSFNFNPFYYFDGTNDFFYRLNDLYFPTATSPGSVYSVAFNSAAGGWRSPFCWGDDDPGLNRAGDAYYFFRDNGAPVSGSVGLNTKPAHIANMLWRGATNGVYLDVDGQVFTSTAYNIGTINNSSNPTNFAIGSEGYNVAGTGNEQHQGGISEIFAYSVDHQNSGGDEKLRINSYLALKYGITLKNDAGTRTSRYLSSTSAVIWDTTVNAGYNNSIAGITKDDNSALHQKQSRSNVSGPQVLIGTTGLANTNAANSTGLNDGQFLLWGDNGQAKSLSASFTYPSVPGLNLRFAAIWKVQNTNSIATVRVAWPSGVPGIHLIQSTDAIFDDTDPRTDMTGNTTTINGVVYNYADVTLTNGQYFTFAGYVVGPGNVASAAWYRADAAGQLFSDAGITPVTDGQDIQQWNEYRGTGHNFSRYGGDQRPRFSDLTTLANFNPTATFNNARLYYNPLVTNQIIERANGSIYAAGYVNTINQTGFFGFNESNDDPGLHIFGAQDKLLFYTKTGSSYTGYSSNAFAAKSYFTAGAAWLNGTTNLDTATVSLNGNRTGYNTSNAIPNVLNTDNNARDMMMGTDGNTGALNGQLNELVVFEQNLNEAEMDRVETYMAIKYGTTFASGTRDYKNSSNGTVWTATTNNGFHYNIAGISRDDLGSLSQKQSWSTNAGKQVLISTTGLANTNATNTGVLSNGQFLIWGDNNRAKAPTVAITGIADVNYRFASVWKVQNTNAVGTVRVAWPKGYTNLKLIQSADTVFNGSDVSTDMTNSQVVNSVEYAYADVTLSNGQYFTFAAFIQAPGGVTHGLSHWYRADKLVESTGEGTDVTLWTDFTSGVMSEQIGTAALPKFKNGAFDYFNYNPGINFTAGTQKIGNISVQTLNSLNYGIFSVTKEGMTNGVYFNIGMNNTTFDGTNWDQPGLWGGGTVTRRTNTGGSNFFAGANPAFASNVSSIMYYNFSDISFNKSLNGAPIPQNYTNAPVGLVTGGHIFGSNAGSGSSGDDGGFIGHIGELVVYGNDTISAAERNKVNSYLAVKYGVTLHNSQNYTTSQNVVVWTAAANTAFYNNVAGVGTDYISALEQKQSRSQHTNTNGQVIMGLGTIDSTNFTNNASLADGKFLLWGDNGSTVAMTNTATTFTVFNYEGGTNNARRMKRTWKVQNTGVSNQMMIRFPVASVGTTTLPVGDACADYAILFADDTAFSTNLTVVPLTVNGTDYEVLHAFANGMSYFTFAKLTPLNNGQVYLPAVTESTVTYDNACNVGTWKYFHKTGDATQKLFGASDYTATELGNLGITIRPEGTEYNDGIRISKVMPRITTVTNNNIGPISSGKVRVYYSVDEMNATIVSGSQTNGWFKYEGDSDSVLTDIYNDGIFNPGKAVALTPAASGIENGVHYVEFHNINSFSSFVYISSTEITSVVLPVTLLYFAAEAKGSEALLSWGTAKESMNKGFEIERSADGENWSRIGFVASRAANGNSATRLDYTFADKAPLEGKNFYRLKQIGLDGKDNYSQVSMVVFDGTKDIRVYPNPVSNRLTVDGLRSAGSIRVVNSTGQVLRTVKVPAGTQKQEINMSDLASGMYFIHLVNEQGIIKTFKVMKD